MVQNLSKTSFFQEKVEFLKSASGFNFTLHQTKIHYFTHPLYLNVIYILAGSKTPNLALV